MSSTLEASVFMGKNYSENSHSIKNTGKNSDVRHIWKVDNRTIRLMNTIKWGDSAWKHLSLIGNKEVVSLSRAKVCVFSDSVLCLGKAMIENPLSNVVWEDKWTWFKSSSQHRTLDTIDREPMEFEWNISQDSPHCRSATKSKSSCQKLAYNQKISQDGLSSCRCSTTSHGDLKTMNRNANQALNSVSIYAKRFSPGRWSFLGPGSEKKWHSTLDCKPQGEWDRVAELMMLKFGESRHPVFPSTSPLSREVLKSTGGGQISIHFCTDEGTIETVFHTVVSVDQLSIYGAVSDLCDECKSCHVRTGRLVLVGQSDPLFVPTSVMKTPTPLTDDHAQEDLLQKYQERVDKLSQQDRVIKFCIDAGFSDNGCCRTVFHDKRHWRIFTIYRFSGLSWVHFAKRWTIWSEPKGWIRGNTNDWACIGSHNQLTYKVNMEWKSEVIL